MSSGLYQMEVCIKSMRKNRKLNVFVIISLCVGMLIPLIALADIQYFREYGKTLLPAIRDRTVEFYGISAPYDLQEICERLKEEPYCVRAAVSKNGRRDTKYQGKSVYENVYMVSREYFDFYPMYIVEGRGLETMDFEAEQKICLVEENYFQDNGLPISLDEKILIDGVEYSIGGISRKMDNRGSIWIPVSKSALIPEGKEVRVLMEYVENTDMSEIERAVRPLVGELISVDTLVQKYNRQRKQGLKLCAAILFLIFPLLAFSVVNCFAVIQGKLRRMRRQFAVEIAYGAGRKEIFMGCLAENILLCMAAIFLDSLILPIVVSYVPAEIEMVWTWNVYLEMCFLILCLCAVLGGLSAISIGRMRPAEILRGE